MNKNLLILSVICLLVFQTACNVSEKAEEAMEMPDLKVEKGNKGNEVVFDDAGFEKQKNTFSTFGDVKEPQTYTDKDGSEVRISFDAAGNKIGHRKFFNHPNLTFLQLTEATDGTKEGVVFGHNGEKKRLTPQMIEQALTISGDDLASKAGIYSVKREKNRGTEVVKNPTPPPFYPSRTFPTQETFDNRNQPQTTEIQPSNAGETPTETPPANPQITQNGKPKDGDNL
jgi:hypothetical protein